MPLSDLLGVNLDRIRPDAETVGRLLHSADRHIADARVSAISAETRFTSSYTAARMLADIGLHANGYRILTSKPGHHIVAIQALTETLGIDPRVIIRLDALRKQRNAAEYSGDLVPESAVTECLSQAESLYKATVAWLKIHKPRLLSKF